MTTTTRTSSRTSSARAAAKPTPKTVSKTAAKPIAKTAAKAVKVAPKAYVLLTGVDDSVFCQRVSDKLKEGYELYGSPSVTFNGKNVIAAQALVLKKKVKKGKK